MKRLDKRELSALRKEVSAEIKEIKRDIKAAEKADEFSRKVDRLYDSLEGNELLLDAIDMAISNISSRLDDKGWEAVIDDFKDAVEFADSNKASFSSRDVLDRVLISDANENMIRRIKSRKFETQNDKRDRRVKEASNASFEEYSDDSVNDRKVDKAVSAKIYDKVEDLFHECWELYKKSFNGLGANRKLMSYRNLDRIQKLLTELEV